MTSTSARPSSTNIVHRGKGGAGPFMLTLCRLAEPVSIRPPQAPHLRPFTFFTSRAPQQDGSDHLYLHMGFFETLASAEKWARAVRGRHPGAIATAAPRAFWQLPDAESPSSQPVAAQGGSANNRQFAPVNGEPLTDTQVLNILEVRRYARPQNDGDERANEQIELIRPDDTAIRRALKEAVVQGVPVSFAVQLHWSTRPIDPTRLPALEIFDAYTLYGVETRRANRSCFFLRLGFFSDPVSAKQVALHVRSTFASAAVVPVLDEEITRAREPGAETSIPCLVQQRRAQLDCSGTAPWATLSQAESAPPRSASPGAETLEQTLAQLAERELWNDPDVLSDTGVRHLKVEMEQRKSGRRH